MLQMAGVHNENEMVMRIHDGLVGAPGLHRTMEMRIRRSGNTLAEYEDFLQRMQSDEVKLAKRDKDYKDNQRKYDRRNDDDDRDYYPRREENRKDGRNDSFKNDSRQRNKARKNIKPLNSRYNGAMSTYVLGKRFKENLKNQPNLRKCKNCSDAPVDGGLYYDNECPKQSRFKKSYVGWAEEFSDDEGTGMDEMDDDDWMYQ